MIGLLCIVIAFHLCVLVGIVPYDITWGGRLESMEEMYMFETISIAVTSFLLIVLLMKGQLIKNHIHVSWLNTVIWIFVFLFSLNTIGNLFAKATVEMIVGGFFTFISAILCYRIARD